MTSHCVDRLGPPETTAETEGATAVSGSRGARRLYDRWSRHPRALALLYGVVFLGRGRSIRRRSIEALGLGAGDRVLELGCGPGNSFAALRRRVGETGRVVGVDYSVGMVDRAADRVREAGWENVHVVRGDATRPGVEPETFDGVYAAMSLSAMPGAVRAIREAFTHLRAGGRIVVLDARPFQRLPWTLLNPLVVPVSKRLTNWVPAIDIPAAMGRSFGAVSVTDANGGSIFIARARKGGTETADTGQDGTTV